MPGKVRNTNRTGLDKSLYCGCQHPLSSERTVDFITLFFRALVNIRLKRSYSMRSELQFRSSSGKLAFRVWPCLGFMAQDKDKAAETVIKLYQEKQISGIQLTEKLESIFKKDHSLEQTKKVLDACSPYKVTGHDSPVDVQRFLSDFRPLQGTVSTTYPPTSSLEYFVYATEIGSFGNCIGSLISGPKGKGDGEEYVAFKSMSFQQIWEHLSDHGGPKQLNYRPSKNISEKTTNNWKLFIKSTRPDNIVMIRGKIYFYGQEKEKAAEFERAKMELTEKMVDMPPAMYGELKFVICYAAAAEYIQFFMFQLRKADGAPILTPVTDVLDMNKDRPQLVLCYIKLYFLLLGMDACGSDFKYKLHTEIQHGHSLITLTLDGAEKKIPNFEAFSKEFLVDFQDLVTAYDAASLCDGYLIGSVLGPRLQEEDVEVEVEVSVLETQVTTGKRKSSDSTTTGSTATNSLNKKPKSTKKCLKKDTTRQTKTVKQKVYRVETTPLCAERAPASEDDLRAMAIAGLEALKALHGAGLVHRDIRLSNVMYDYSEEKYVLIDLESVSKENLAPGFKFKCWKPKTLERVGDQHQYTKLSDLHQLGVLLRDCGATVERKSTECLAFITLLLSKGANLTAHSLLADPWIQGTRSPIQGTQSPAS